MSSKDKAAYRREIELLLVGMLLGASKRKELSTLLDGQLDKDLCDLVTAISSDRREPVERWLGVRDVTLEHGKNVQQACVEKIQTDNQKLLLHQKLRTLTWNGTEDVDGLIDRLDDVLTHAKGMKK